MGNPTIRKAISSLVALATLAISAIAFAQAQAVAAGPTHPTQPTLTPPADPLTLITGQGLTTPMKILALLSILSVLPAIVLTMTSFTRVVVVLSFVRQGIGTQQAPPSQVLIGIALFITMFTMAPIATTIANDAYKPYVEQKISEDVAIDRAIKPLRAFMLKQTREADLALFYNAAKLPFPKTAEEVPMRIAAPAFIVSELTTAFEMGVLVLLPFLVIDIAVSSTLMSMGMMMVPPASIALPIKILLFVIVDGWNLLVGSLLRSFA